MAAASLHPLNSRNLVHDAVQALRRCILDGEFGPTGELPSQGALGAHLGVSRSVVREAMKVLESQGLIEISQGRRPRVLPASPLAAVNTLSTLVQRSAIGMEQLLEVRRPLEIEIAGLAAQLATDAQIQRMEAAIEALAEAREVEVQVAADMEFHKILAEASGNVLFGVMLDVLAELLRESRRMTIPVSGVETARTYHLRILEAVKARDVEEARTSMQEHMDQTRRDLQGGKKTKR